MVFWRKLDWHSVPVPAASFFRGVALRFLVPDEDGRPKRFFPFVLAGTLDEGALITAPDDEGRLTHDVGFLRQYSWMLICTTQLKSRQLVRLCAVHPMCHL
jgi:hypothetical protein